VVLEGPDEVPAGVTDVLLDERHARVVEGRPAVDDAVVAPSVLLVYHGEIELVDPRRVDLYRNTFYVGSKKVKYCTVYTSRNTVGYNDFDIFWHNGASQTGNRCEMGF
jgi:hypothetical protein